MATFLGDSGLPHSDVLATPAATEEPTQRLSPRKQPDRASMPASALSEAEAHLELAIAASARIEAGLGVLSRAVQHLSAGMSSVREANENLTRELGVLHEQLAASLEADLVFRHRSVMLEQALARSERERNYLIQQQDGFIVLLLEDHERELASLRAEALRTTAGEETDEVRVARDALVAAEEEILRLRMEREQLKDDLARAQVQREEAQGIVVRIASERDQALIELSRTRSSERQRAPLFFRPSEAPQPVARLELESLPRRSSGPSAAPLPAGAPDEAGPRTAPSPEGISSTGPGPSVSESPPSGPSSSKPPLKQKPDPSTRPLIGYSLAGGELLAERLEGARISSRPPER
ncbi:MAG TPA: hypothetical protein VIM73_10675 [Polyangiaceae bacterium]